MTDKLHNIAAMVCETDEPGKPADVTGAMEGAVMEVCWPCRGSGYGGHPDSGYVCYECNGSGETPVALSACTAALAEQTARAEASEARVAEMTAKMEATVQVAVKPLEWEGFVAGNYRIEVEKGGIANLRHYSASMVEDEEPTMLKGGYLTLVSLDDLKAAAQADYEARIRSALIVTPAPSPDVGELVEAASNARLALAGYVDRSHAIDLLDAALAKLKDGDARALAAQEGGE